MAKQHDDSSMSKGQLKRMARRQAIKQEQKKSKVSKILTYSLLIVLAIGILSSIGYSIYQSIIKVKPSSNYSAYLTEDGLIKDVIASDLLDLADYKNITIPLSEIEYSDESVDTDIQGVLENNKTLATETDAGIADGDTVNIDYVGSVDGVEFEGGNTEGAGTDLTIGSATYIDDFENQLIGSTVGDEVTVNVTFPEDYGNKELNGKNAIFKVTINGIYEIPEFDDAFVQENLSDYASTAEGYRTYLKETNYENNLSTWIEDYLSTNTTVSSYPEKYTKHLKSTTKYDDQTSYEYMNELYTSMGYGSMTSFSQYTGMPEKDYDNNLVSISEKAAKKALIYQAILENEGLTVTEDDYQTYFQADTDTDFETRAEQYGKGYVMQEIIAEKATEFVKEHAIIE